MVKANGESRREYFQNAIYSSKKDVKSMWKTVNNLLGRANCSVPSSV